MISFLANLFEPKSVTEKRGEERHEAENMFGVDFQTEGPFRFSGQGSGKDISSLV